MPWSSLISHADGGSRDRGRDYAAQGLVRLTSVTADTVRGEASGSATYDVVLHPRTWSCSCPVGLRQAFCKHLVAAALLADGEDPVALGGSFPAPVVPPVAERGRLSPEEAVDLLRTRRHLDYGEANDHARLVEHAAEELEAALAPATADELLPLIARAVELVARTVQRSDDSSGLQTMALERLLGLHARAADLGGPDPAKLARWLIATSVRFDFLLLDVPDYAGALGAKGLAVYTRALDERLVAEPASEDLLRMRGRLAVVSGDVEEIVRHVGRDLRGGSRHLDLVGALLDARLPGPALGYAVEGASSAVGPVASRLYDAAVGLLVESGDVEAAVGLRREQLARLPDEASYRALRRTAQGRPGWPLERLDALDVLLEHQPRAWLTILLDEGETDLAWESARTMEVHPALRLALVRARATTHPAEVLDDYVRLVRRTLEPADQQAYRQGVAHLGELRRVAEAAGLSGEYAALLAELLDTHRRRPTLVAMLERLPR